MPRYIKKGLHADYSKENYCSRCEKVCQRPARYCPECGHLVRHRAVANRVKARKELDKLRY